MKRLALLATLFLMASAVSSHASTNRVAPHLVVRPVMWRVHTTTVTNNFKLDEAGVGCVDSVAYSRQTNGSLLSATDTTVAIPLIGLLPPGQMSAVAPTTLVADSFTVAGRFFISDAGNTGAVDSMYILPQVSVDKKTWINVNAAASATDLTSGTGFYGTLAQASPISGATFKVFNFPVKWGASRCNASLGEVSTGDLRYWPYIRFIVANDGSSATVIKNFNGYWVSYQTGEELNSSP